MKNLHDIHWITIKDDDDECSVYIVAAKSEDRYLAEDELISLNENRELIHKLFYERISRLTL